MKDWSLPKDHPALIMLLQEIKILKEQLQESQLTAAMYYRNTQMLAAHLDLKTVLKVHKKVWG